MAAPEGLREVLESSRLRLLALFRALDRVDLAQELPRELHGLFFDLALWHRRARCVRHYIHGVVERSAGNLVRNTTPHAMGVRFARQVQLRVHWVKAVNCATAALNPRYLYWPEKSHQLPVRCG